MKKIKLVISLISIPVMSAFSQGNTTETASSEKKPVAVFKSPRSDSLKALRLQSQSQEVANDLNRPNKKTLANNTPSTDHSIQKKYEYKGSKFEKVPLLGDIDYFGKNHDIMLAYTKKYHSGRKKTFAAVMQRDRQGKIFQMMDKVFDKHDIPHELKYLSVIESALNRTALSPVGAYGPWQFMPETGRYMGLTVTAAKDERADWSRSTHAACKYLTYLYNMFDDWLLVVASYNSGPRPVLNAIKKTGKKDFWSIKKYLPNETQNHVMAFVATATVFEYFPHYAATGMPPDFDWSVLNRKAPTVNVAEAPKSKNPLAERFSKNELAKMTMVKISEPVDLDYLANFLEHDRAVLQRWNYDYITFLLDYKPGDTYSLRLPKEKLDKFLQNKTHILTISKRKMSN